MCAYTVSDGQGGVAVSHLTVSVTKVNAPPSIDNPGNQQTAEGSPVSLQLIASDPEGDPLTFTATGLPPGFLLHGSHFWRASHGLGWIAPGFGDGL